uniref:TIR domain-containing protein n=1 Tax=Salix viminalis TaxID=40686 RepID=A0A6N2M3K1_SALVM
MSRQDGADLHHVDRSFGKHVEKMDDGRMGCKFCEHEYAKDTAITRIKYHLAGVKGHGVRICAQVPRDVQDAALAAIPIDGRPEKKLKTVAGPLQTGSFHEPRGDPSQPTNDQFCSPSVNNDVSVNDAQNIVGVRTEQNNEVDNVPVVDTMAHAPGRSVEMEPCLEACLLEDSIDNGTGGVAQPGAEASSSGGLRHNPSETRWSNDVFLSFRGEDTRKNFTDHLHSALIQARIRTFKDDNDLLRGEEISPQLLRAIEGSRISVVVFSRNYASSTWCLDELVKIMECRQKTNQVVIPVFYDTDPSDVRKQTGSYAKAFDEHEKNFKGEMEKVKRWREALTKAANLSGRDLQNETNGYEAKFIQKVVKELAEHVAEHPVALLLTGSTRLVGQGFEENKNLIWSCLTNDEVSTMAFAGWGSRIHKLQNKIADNIKLSFSNEEELGHRAAELSQELMKKQRWILILDDLWNSFELHEVGIPVPLKGCKLLVTTRSEAVCRQMNSKNNVRVNPLSNEEAWTLFMEVHGNDIPLSPQVEQVARDITGVSGLPWELKRLLNHEGVENMHEWSDALEDLRQSKVPQDKVEEEVFRILRFSYTHLHDRALRDCFLYCGLFPEDFEIPRENLIDYLIDEGVVKQQKSREAEINKGHTMLDRLEKVCLLERLRGGNYVKMHDLIRDMAIQILEENSQAIVKAGAQLKELPDAHECPNLSTLLLCDNRQLGFIADLFFKQLHRLKRLSSVPSLKKLRALKRLDISGAPLKKIPHGMEYLSNLRKEVGCLRKLESLECHFEDQSNYLEYLKSRDATQSLRTYKIVVGQLREDHDKRLRHTGGGTKMVGLGNLNINRDGDFLVISSNDIQQLICICIDAGSIGDVLPLKYRLSSCNSIENLVSSCSAPLPQPSPSYNGIFSALKFLSCYGCKSMKKLFPLVLLPYLINLKILG